MDKTQGLKVTRRSILKTIPALSAISAGSSFFTKAACAQEPLEDGYTICDNCNQMPMCGIHFQRQGNIVVSVGNWKEHSGKLLCNKALATLQRLYNPNRLLYPMKRTNPKTDDDPGWMRITWDEAFKTTVAKAQEVQERYGGCSIAGITGTSRVWPMAGTAGWIRMWGSPNGIQAWQICKGPRHFTAISFPNSRTPGWRRSTGRGFTPRGAAPLKSRTTTTRAERASRPPTRRMCGSSSIPV